MAQTAMLYHAPIHSLLSTMRAVGGMDDAALYPDLADGAAEAILEEAGRFASGRIAPLNMVGDRHAARITDGRVTTPPGWKETYRDWAEGGWNALAAPEAFGGQGLPILLNVACAEIWNASSIAFALCPLLTAGAIEALTAHGAEDLQARYLPKLVSGQWTGTMNLTEPQAGSDLSALRSRAERAGDGTYRITGQKIYITYGEHDCAENIVHLVLARLSDAPAGTRGISLFLVPKILPDGTHNDLRCHSIEHKLGIHGSPTCTMIFGDAGGAKGWLIGEENRGLACMFTMMNNARLMVGVQGAGIAERATQQALAFAKERRQGRASTAKEGMSPIIEHPDVRRMLLEMRAKTSAARSLCMATAAALDGQHRLPEEKRAAAARRASLLTPLAKSYSTDIALEVASLGVQIHGGMGFVEETGAAQHYRDARILPIYEGTNGIQAIDLVMRKLPLAEGETAQEELTRCKASAQKAATSGDAGLAASGAILAGAAEAAASCIKAFAGTNNADSTLAGATPFQRLFATVSAGANLIDIALATRGSAQEKMALSECRFFIGTETARAESLAAHILNDADVTLEAEFG
jgi:acyl-CoA dehydrogenase